MHAKGSYIFLQLWALGRAAIPDQLKSEDLSLPCVSASDIPMKGGISPRPLTLSEIQEYVELYATAASNAVHLAGFDGVEVHGANGYLVEQFLQDVSNVRTDAYGGSPEKRSRFALEVVDAIVKRVGERKTAIRLSPWNTYQSMCAIFCCRRISCSINPPVGMGMKDPIPTYGYLVSQLRENHPNLAYIHVVEPRVDGPGTKVADFGDRSNDFIRNIWESGDGAGSRRLISAGGYTRALGMERADEKGDLIAYGRPFISNVRLSLCIDLSLLNTCFSLTFLIGYKMISNWPSPIENGITSMGVLIQRDTPITPLQEWRNLPMILYGLKAKCDGG